MDTKFRYQTLTFYVKFGSWSHSEWHVPNFISMIERQWAGLSNNRHSWLHSPAYHVEIKASNLLNVPSTNSGLREEKHPVRGEKNFMKFQSY